MSLPDTLDAARDLALQKIGRHVLNFQRMEAALKVLVAFGRLEGPASELQARLSKQIRSASNMTMGTLAPRLVDTLYRKIDATPVVVPHPTEISMSIAIHLEGGEEDAELLRKTLAEVVGARNRLIHETLARFDTDSIESCHALCETLDAQRTQFTPIHQHLSDLVALLKELGEGAAEDMMRVLAEPQVERD